MFQLMPLPLTVSCFSKIQIGFAFLVPAHLCSPGKRAIKRACVCVCFLACCFANVVGRPWLLLWICIFSANQGQDHSTWIFSEGICTFAVKYREHFDTVQCQIYGYCLANRHIDLSQNQNIRPMVTVTVKPVGTVCDFN